MSAVISSLLKVITSLVVGWLKGFLSGISVCSCRSWLFGPIVRSVQSSSGESVGESVGSVLVSSGGSWNSDWRAVISLCRYLGVSGPGVTILVLLPLPGVTLVKPLSVSLIWCGNIQQLINAKA